MTLTGKTQIELDTETLKTKQTAAQAKVSSLIDAVYWRIQRYESQIVLETTTTDSEADYKKILQYVQALREVNHQDAYSTDPDSIIWPSLTVTSITLDSTASVSVDSTVALLATCLPSTALDITRTWSSSDTSIATVDYSGKVTGVAAGTATITATCGGFSATCTVTVSAVE